jgi:hypothetical protein
MMEFFGKSAKTSNGKRQFDAKIAKGAKLLHAAGDISLGFI